MSETLIVSAVVRHKSTLDNQINMDILLRVRRVQSPSSPVRALLLPSRRIPSGLIQIQSLKTVTVLCESYVQQLATVRSTFSQIVSVLLIIRGWYAGRIWRIYRSGLSADIRRSPTFSC